ncbi:MAG: bifunctional metallophosphatase/5'-nucleotidase [Anaerolineae bacterium]|nr:bifunctional metallophosphatase/5'-nucleotidase [Anaerolineae bacterium]
MKRLILLSAILLLLAACRQFSADEPALPASAQPTATNSGEPTATELPATEPPATATPEPVATDSIADSVRTVTVLYTNDEHGWMAGNQEGSSAANLLGLWHANHTCFADDSCLILSGGDMWTGPAISTWFEGESMAEALNAMGYAAAAIGNHEFDFGIAGLEARAAQSNFPFVSANMRYKDTGAVPIDLGVQPYTVVERNGVRIGIIGLTTTTTPQTTAPYNVEPFDFIDYETALREIVPQIQAEDIDLIVVPAHLCERELVQLVPSAVELGVHLLGGGHCNELVADSAESFVTLIGGGHLRSYAWADLSIDLNDGSVSVITSGTAENSGGAADPAVQAIIDRWQAATDAELDVTIGYLGETIKRQSPTMQKLITETWLEMIPTADVALTNLGGMRDDLRAGPITYADFISVSPFNNVLVDVQLSGADLIRTITTADRVAVGGLIRKANGDWELTRTGELLVDDEIYSVLVSDFMYAGGDDFTLLAEADPDGYNTAIDWRQPTLDWMIAQNSSAENPLDDAIAQLGR